MPTAASSSRRLHLPLSASAIGAFSLFVSRFGSVPGSFFTISGVASRTSSSGCTCLRRAFASLSMSCSCPMSSGSSSISLATGSPFSCCLPPLWPMISLRHAQGAARGTPFRSATSAAVPVLASSSATACTFLSRGTGPRSGPGPLRFLWPGAYSSIHSPSSWRLLG